MSYEAEVSLLGRARGIVAKPEFFFIFAIAGGMLILGFGAIFMSSAVTGLDHAHNSVIVGVSPIVLGVEALLIAGGIALQIVREFGAKALVITLALVALGSAGLSLWIEGLAEGARHIFDFGAIDIGIAFAIVSLVGLGWAARNIMVIVVGLFAGLAGVVAIIAALWAGPVAGGLVTAGALCIVSFFLFSR